MGTKHFGAYACPWLLFSRHARWRHLAAWGGSMMDRGPAALPRPGTWTSRPHTMAQTTRALSRDLFIFSIPPPLPLLLSFRSLTPRVAAPLWPFVILFKYVSSHTLALTSLCRRALRADDEIWYITGLRRWRLSETTVDHNGLGVTHLTFIQKLIVQSYWACFGLYPSSCMWKTKNPTTFRRLDLSPSSGGWNWVGLSCPIHLRTDPVSETLWDFLSSTYKTMDRVKNKPNSSVQHTPSSESFQVYQKLIDSNLASATDLPSRAKIIQSAKQKATCWMTHVLFWQTISCFSSVSTTAKITSYRQHDLRSISATEIFLAPLTRLDWFLYPSSFSCNEYRLFVPGFGEDAVWSRHFHVVPKSRMRGDLLPSPLDKFTAWC
jgi:hypothetical protein